MDQYLPPLVAVSAATVIVLLCFTLRVPFFIVGILSVAMAIYVLQDHMIVFSYQYSYASVPAFFKDNASTFITIIVIILSLGFLLFKFGPQTVINNEKTRFDAERQSRGNGFFDRMRNRFFSSGQNYRRDDNFLRSSVYNKYV